MRRLTLLALAVLAVGCAKTDDDASLPADTAQVAPAAPAGISLADVSGTWHVNVMPADKDTVVTSYTLWASDDASAWKMNFDGRPDTMAVQGVAVAGDSVIMKFGPYSSAVRKGVTTVTDGVARLQAGRMVGTATAHYSVTTPDSVLHFRIDGTRAN